MRLDRWRFMTHIPFFLPSGVVPVFLPYITFDVIVSADSLSAIKFAKVKPIRNEEGITEDFEIEGDFPKYGNDDDRVDSLAVEIVQHFIGALKKHKLYRGFPYLFQVSLE